MDISTKDYATLERKSHFYVMGHLSKVIAPGDVRIATTGFQTSGLYYTAVLNPDGTYELVLQNDTNSSIKVTLADASHSFIYTLPAKSINSCRWKKIMINYSFSHPHIIASPHPHILTSPHHLSLHHLSFPCIQ